MRHELERRATTAGRTLRALACALVALAALFAPAARALAPGPQSPIQGEVVHRWPERLGKGYFPVWVKLRNLTREEERVTVVAGFGGGNDQLSTTKTLTLEPDREQMVELFVPAFPQTPYPWGSCNVMVRAGRMFRLTLGSAQVQRVQDEKLRAVLVLGAARQDTATHARWSSELSTDTLTVTWTGTSEPNVSVGSGSFALDMPTYAESYSSLDLVVLDLSRESPGAEALAPLVQWVRLGGRLFVLGEDAPAKARAIAPLGEWMEDRFRLESDVPAETTYACGLGVLHVASSGGEAFGDAEARAVRIALTSSRGTSTRGGGPAPVRVPHETVRREHVLTIPGVGDLPYEVFLVLLLGFAIVIGPVNFIALRRMSRPFLLLLTVPAISAVASLAIFLYGAFAQGFESKGGSRSLTLLDQRGGRASTVEERSAYYPLAPASGLRPEAGTSVFPLLVDEQRIFAVDLSEGVHLGSGYLPVRTQTDHIALTDRPAHLALRFERADDGYAVQNELPVAVEELVLRAPDGHTHVLRGRLEPAARAVLEPAPDLDLKGAAYELVRHPLLADKDLVESTFVAKLEHAPFVDACGVDVELLVEEHAVYGVLPEREEEW